jgi:hypothetical protein
MDTLPKIEEEKIEVTTLAPLGEKAELPSSESVQTKAEKFSYAVSGDFSEVPRFTQYLNANLEESVRQQRAVEKQVNLQFNVVDEIKRLSANPERTEKETQDLQTLISFSPVPTTFDPRTVFEKDFANEAINSTITINENPLQDEFINEFPDQAYTAMNLTANNIAIREIVGNKTLEINDKLKNMGWGDFALNLGAFVIPWYEEYNLNNSGIDLPETYFLGGNLKTAIIDRIFSLPAEEAADEIDRILKELENNPLVQKGFLDSLWAFTKNDQFLGNVFSALDIGTSVAGAPKFVLAGAMTAANIGTRGAMSVSRLYNTLGRGPQAASAYIQEILKKSAGELSAKDPFKLYEDFNIIAPEAFSDAARIGQSSQFATGTQAYLKIKNRLDLLQAAENAVISGNRIQRLTPEAADAAVRATLKDFVERNVVFDPVNNVRYTPSVQVIDTVAAEKTIENVGYLNVRIGDYATGLGFNDPRQAAIYAEGILSLDKSSYKLSSQGNQFYIDYIMPVRENFDEVDDVLISGTNVFNDNLRTMDYILSAATNPSKFFSEAMNARLKAATHLPSYMVKNLQDVAGPLNALARNPIRKGEFKALRRVLEENQRRTKTVLDPITKEPVEKKGHLNTTQAELEQNYYNVNGRLPTERESLAYWSYKKLSDIDYRMRNINLYQSKVTIGVKEITFPLIPVSPNGSTGKITDLTIEGIPQAKLPSLGNKEFTIARINTTGGLKIHKSHELNKTPRADMATDMVEMQRLIDEEGYKLIQIAQPDTNPLKAYNATDERVDFVLVPVHREKNLGLKQVEYNPNHWQYTKDKYVQQAGVEASASGVKTTKPNTYIVASSDAEANKWATAMETARIMLKSALANPNNTQLMNDYRLFVRSNLPDDADWIANKYQDIVDPNTGAISKAEWDIDSPWTNVGYGDDVSKLTANELKAVHGDALRISDDFEYNAMEGINKKFLGEKTAFVKEATRDGSSTQQAGILDPLHSMQDGMRNIVRNTVMDDTKKFALRTWINEFGDLFDVPIEQVKKDPTFYFFNGNLRQNVTDQAKLQRALASKKSLENFFGIYKESRGRFDIFKNKLLDSVFERLGQGAADKLDTYLMTGRNPFKVARAFAFHTKMGFFNPRQYFMGLQTIMHSSLIVGDPKIAYQGSFGYMLSNALRANNSDQFRKFVNSAANKVLGFKGDEFLESHDAARKAGIDIIEGEHVFQDNYNDYKLFQSNAGIFLDKGLGPFRAGDRANRMAAWHMAYLEWRKANPNVKLEQSGLDWILNRHEILTNNMTRKSSSPIQQNQLGSFITQFWGYNMRLTEAFIGTELTAMERWRLIAGYAAMYGVNGLQSAAMPINIGSAALQAVGFEPTVPYGGLGGSTDFNKDTLAYMQKTGDNSFDFAVQGMLGLALEAITGEKTNVSSSFGPGAMAQFAETAEGRIELINFFASSSIIADAYKNAVPFVKDLYGIFNGEFNTKRTMQDFIRSISVISTVSNLEKAYTILTENVRRAKDGRYQEGDVDAVNAALQLLGITGLDYEKVMTEFSIGDRIDRLVEKHLKEYKALASRYMQYYGKDNELAETYKVQIADLHNIILELDASAYKKIQFAWDDRSLMDAIETTAEQRRALTEGKE